MRDNSLYILLREFVMTKLAVRGIAGYDVVQNYQPTQQGRPIDAAIIIYRTFNKRYGHPQISQRYNTLSQAMERTEKIYMESTYKVTAIVPPQLEDMNAITQADAVAIAAAIMQSEDFITHLKQYDCGVLRITDMVNIQIENDQGQNEMNYSFDVIITHSDTFVDGVPIITEFDFSTVAI